MSGEEWEAIVGGSWLNKLGVFVLVIGIALFLGYSFTRMGPPGRVAVELAVSFAMLGGGIMLERRARYTIFARGLSGRRLGRALFHDLRDALGEGGEGDRQRSRRHAAAAGGGHGDDPAFAAISFADRHWPGVLSRIRDAVAG